MHLQASYAKKDLRNGFFSSFCVYRATLFWIFFNIRQKVSPISNEINKLLKDNSFIDGVLKEGAEKANKITTKKINEMKKIIGF